MISNRVDELLSLWEAGRDAGQSVSAEELCADDPELLQEVRWTIHALEKVESHFGVPASDAEMGGTSADTSAFDVRAAHVDVRSRYDIERLHASGGLGRVFIAMDRQLNRRVAIKFPVSSFLTTEARARFRREADVTSRLDHPGIIPVHAIDDGDKVRPPCYVMRFVEGQTLHEAIEQSVKSANSGNAVRQSTVRAAATDTDPVSPPPESPATTAPATTAPVTRLGLSDLLLRFVTVCNIAAFAHSRGVIHRDIKPANILLGEFGETLLLDWGLAKLNGDQECTPHAPRDATVAETPVVAGNSDTAASDRDHHAEQDEHNESTAFHTQSGQLLGTPAYASPEQLLGRTGEIDERSDVYSLGATLFRILTGESIFRPEGMPQHLDLIQAGVIPDLGGRLSHVPRPLSEICRKALSIPLHDRYPTAIALARDVEHFLRDEPISLRRESFREQTVRWLRRHPQLTASVGGATVVILAAALTGAFILEQKNSQLLAASENLQTANQSLTESNDELQKAIERAETNNIRAMKALKSLTEFALPLFRNRRSVFTDAEETLLRKVVQQYREFAEIEVTSPETRYIRAMGLMNCGALHLSLRQPAEALTMLTQARDGFLQITEPPHDAPARRGLAEVHVLLGDCRLQEGNHQEAANSYEASIAGFDECLARAAKAEMTDLTIRRIGVINQLVVMTPLGPMTHTGQQRLAVLLQEAEKSLTEIMKTDEDNTEAAVALLDTLGSMKLALLKVSNNDAPSAVESKTLLAVFERMHSLASAVLKREPTHPRAQLHLAQSLRSLAQAHTSGSAALSDTTDPVPVLTRAIDVLTSLTGRFPNETEITAELSHALADRAEVFKTLGRSDLASADQERSVRFRADSVALNAAGHNAAIQLYNQDLQLARRRADSGHLTEAAAMFEDLLADMRIGLQDRPAQYLEQVLAETLREQADVLTKLRDHAAAERSLSEAIPLFVAELADRQADISSVRNVTGSLFMRNRLAGVYQDHARLLRQMKRFDDAKTALGEVRKYIRPLTETAERSLYSLERNAEFLQELGFVESGLGNFRAAEQAYSEEIPLRLSQTRLRPDSFSLWMRLGGAHCNRAIQLRKAGDTEASLPEFEFAIRVLTENRSRDPKGSANLQFLANSHLNYAVALEELERETEALTQFDTLIQLQPARDWSFPTQLAHARCLVKLQPENGIARVLALCRLTSREDFDRQALAKLCETAAQLSTNSDEQATLREKAEEFRQ